MRRARRSYPIGLMRYVYMVTDGDRCWPMLRDEPDAALWADGQPAVELELLAALPDAVANRLFSQLAELSFGRDSETRGRIETTGPGS